MTITIDIGEAEVRLSELRARVEAGDEVIIARGEAPVVRMTKVIACTDRGHSPDIADAMAEIKKARFGIAPTTIEEILAWRDEGRR